MSFNLVDMPIIPIAAPVIGDREIAYVTDAILSSWVSSLGPYIERFEKEFAAYIGVEHAIAVSNGTAGLHLALHALGIGPGDEVIVPDLTFAATAHAVLQTGATPVFCDVEPDTWCIDPLAVEHAITKRTRAILPVHLYGHPANLVALHELAQENNLYIIEDAAEAHGAEIAQKRVGSFGTAGVFSFYGNKIITTGEGGMITTNDGEFANRVRFLKDHGMKPSRRYFHSELAFNYRMTNIQAALGVAQMEQIETFIAKKRAISTWYSEELSDISDVQFHVERAGTRNVNWLASMVLGKGAALSRDSLIIKLRAMGIDSRPFFVPMHQLPHLNGMRKHGLITDQCPQAEHLGKNGLNLPSSCSLEIEQVKWVCAQLRLILA